MEYIYKREISQFNTKIIHDHDIDDTGYDNIQGTWLLIEQLYFSDLTSIVNSLYTLENCIHEAKPNCLYQIDHFILTIPQCVHTIYNFSNREENFKEHFASNLTKVFIDLLQATNDSNRRNIILNSLLSCLNSCYQLRYEMGNYVDSLLDLIKCHKWKILKIISLIIYNCSIVDSLLLTVLDKIVDEQDISSKYMLKIGIILPNFVNSTSNPEIFYKLLSIMHEISINNHFFTISSEILRCLKMILKQNAIQLSNELVTTFMIILHRSRAFHDARNQLCLVTKIFKYLVLFTQSVEFLTHEYLNWILNDNPIDTVERKKVTTSFFLILLDFAFINQNRLLFIALVELPYLSYLLSDFERSPFVIQSQITKICFKVLYVYIFCEFAELSEAEIKAQIFEIIEELEIPLEIVAYFEYAHITNMVGPLYFFIQFFIDLVKEGYLLSNSELNILAKHVLLIKNIMTEIELEKEIITRLEAQLDELSLILREQSTQIPYIMDNISTDVLLADVVNRVKSFETDTN